jgi:UDP-N-acetylglucosamine/UDP-N-acetylgalactosamine 4-epimerase
MRYLVTGGAGFIGSHLVETLLAQGDEVVILDDFSTGSRENLAGLDSAEVIEGSVVDAELCRRATRGIDFVLHQAALPSVPRSVRDPLATHEACATGTLNLLMASRDSGVRRFVYASSSSAYGNTPELPKHEKMVPRPQSPYAVAKLAGEHYCRAFHSTFRLETIALRYFNVFGPRQNPTSEYSAVIPKLVSAALAGKSPVIFGDGEQTRDFTFVSNAVDANMLACTAPSAACGEAYNVGCGQRVSLNHLWQAIRKLTGASIDASHGDPRPGDVRDSLASLERIGAALGYQPRVLLDEGLARTTAWLSAAERS